MRSKLQHYPNPLIIHLFSTYSSNLSHRFKKRWCVISSFKFDKIEFWEILSIDSLHYPINLSYIHKYVFRFIYRRVMQIQIESFIINEKTWVYYNIYHQIKNSSTIKFDVCGILHFIQGYHYHYLMLYKCCEIINIYKLIWYFGIPTYNLNVFVYTILTSQQWSLYYTVIRGKFGWVYELC